MLEQIIGEQKLGNLFIRTLTTPLLSLAIVTVRRCEEYLHQYHDVLVV